MASIPQLVERTQEYMNELPSVPDPPQIPLGKEVAGWIDHTNLHADATPEHIADLCAEAREYRFAAVCVNPVHVPLASRQLQGSEVEVCTVAGFPLGASLPAVKALEASTSMDGGASEVDMVINIGALKGGDYDDVLKDLRIMAEVVHNQGGILKVIIENALLEKSEKIIACLLAREAGADFVKTSTGFSTGGAVVDDVELMYRVVGPEVKVKAAGGIGSWEKAREMIEAGASRIGASSGIAILKGALQG